MIGTISASCHGPSFFLRRVVAFASPAVVFLVSLGLYIRTMPPCIAVVGYAADALKFQYVGKVLGTPHFGYPTYMFLNILVSRLPFFNLAYRLNLLSALFASCTLVVLYFIIFLLVDRRSIALACTLMFGFTYTYWENSIIAGVYSLNTLFMCSALLLMLNWSKNKRPLLFYLGCFLYAISFGNHLITITLLPGLAYWIYVTDHKILFRKKTYVFIILFMLLGMAQYGYVMLRSYQQPPQEGVFQDWPHTEDFGKTHIETYARSIPEVFDKATGGSEGGRSHTGGMRWKARLGQDPNDPILQNKFGFFRKLLVRQFTPAGVVFALTGIALAFVREQKRALFLLSIIVAHLSFVMTWGIPVNDVHAVPTYLILSIFMAHNNNLFELPVFRRRPNISRMGRACLAGIFVGLTIFLAASRYRDIDKSDNVWLDAMTDTVLSQLPHDSIIFTNHIYATAFWYKLYGENVRPGARITVYPIWRVSYEDLDYAATHYRQVYYFLDSQHWPILHDMGIHFETQNFSRGTLGEYISKRKPGEILAMYMDNRFPAEDVANSSDISLAHLEMLALIGTVEAGGNVRVLAKAQGALLTPKGVVLQGMKMPTKILIIPGENIYVGGVGSSRHMKAYNLVVVNAADGSVNAKAYVDWKHSAIIDPVRFLLVRSYSKSRN